MTEYTSRSQVVCYGRSESTHVLDNRSTEVQVCGELFFPGGSASMLSAACGFHWSLHIQEEIPLGDCFWPTLGPLSDGKESPWDEFFKLSPPPTPAAKAPLEAGGAPARRQRTKLTEKQVAEMEEFARASGWRRLKRDQATINEFCRRIGVDPEKYKTWLKNKKAAQRKKG